MSKSLHFRLFLTYVFINVAKTEIYQLNYLNTSVNPCDDFYEFSCGNFKNVRPKPEDVPLWDHFIILQEELHTLVKAILETRPSNDDPIALLKSREFYSACLNTDYADKLDVPEVAILKGDGNWPIISDFSRKDGDFSWNFVGNLIAAYGVPIFFDVEVRPNLFDAKQPVIYLSKSASTITDVRSRYDEQVIHIFNDKNDKDSIKQPYQIFLEKIALHLRDEIGSFKDQKLILEELNELFDFMQVFDRGGIINGEHPVVSELKTVEELQNWTDTELENTNLISWHTFFNGIFSKSGTKVHHNTTIMITNKAELYGILNLINQTEDSMLKNFAMALLFTNTASDSNRVMRHAYQQFRIDLNNPLDSRSDYCVKTLLSFHEKIGLTLALTYQYQRYHFDINKLKSAEEMIRDLNQAFMGILTDSDWLDEETRVKAFEKVNNMITLLAYPDFIEDVVRLNNYYENIRICAWDHFGNSQRLRAFGVASNLAPLGKPRNRRIWSLSPLKVNAFYNSQNNRILLPVSMLNSVFYTGKIRPLDYGRIGTIIGHEITHGFDSQGMFYDKDGSFTMSWWSPATLAEYNKRANCFIEQYKKYFIPEINEYVNSSRSLKENIADNGGLREAFRAFRELRNRTSLLETVGDYTPEQLFFIGYGTLWCTSQTNEYLHTIHKSTYPPAKYRVIGSLSNNKDFAEAFQCPVGSKMNPKEKCVLW